MLTQALGELLPSAAGVALSPFPIVAVVLLLGASEGRRKAAAFTVGWLVGLSVLALAVVVVAGDVDEPDSELATGIGWTELVVGVLLVALGIRKWRGQPGPDEEVVPPRWMRGIESAGTARAVVLGLVLSGANVKNAALTAAAAVSIAEAGLEGADANVAISVFVLLASSTVLGLVVLELVLGPRAEDVLGAVKERMTRHSALILAVILAIFGAKLIGDGLADLDR